MTPYASFRIFFFHLGVNRKQHFWRDPINSKPQYDYVLYIDEAGDTGRKKLRPEHQNGSSEWFILAGTLINAANEPYVATWVGELDNILPKRQTNEIHFRKLYGRSKRLICEHYASKPLRSFIFASHKKNMRNYNNIRAESARQTGPNWFYNWPIRLLLERVTHYTSVNSLAKPANCGRISKIKIVFSKRGGLKYEDVKSYLKQLRFRDISKTQVNKRGLITWQAIDVEIIEAKPHKSSAGLILPDILASATYAGLEKTSPKYERTSEFFEIIKPTFPMAPRDSVAKSNSRSVSGYSFKLMPGYRNIQTHQDAKNLLRSIGYNLKEWQWEQVRGVRY